MATFRKILPFGIGSRGVNAASTPEAGGNTFSRILATAEQWLIGLVIVLLPLWFFPVPAAVDFAKQWFLVTFTAAVAVIWIVQQFLRGEVRVRWSLAHTSLVALAVVATVSTFATSYRYGSFVGTTNIATSLLSLLALMVFFFVLANRPSSERLLWLSLAALSGFVVALSTTLQAFGLHTFPWNFAQGKNFSTLGSISDAAIYLAILLPLFLGFALVDTRRYVRVLAVIAAVLTLVIVHLIASTTAWLIVGASVLLWLGVWAVRRQPLPPNLLIITILIFAVATLSYFQPRPLVRLGIPVEVGLSYRASASVAGQVLRSGVIPFFVGGGPSTFGDNFALFRPASLNGIAITQGSQLYPLWTARFTSAASFWLTLVASIGVLGLLAFLGSIGILFWRSRKTLINSGTEALLDTSFIATLATLIVASLLQPLSLTILFILFFGLALVVSRSDDMNRFSLRSMSLPSAALIVAMAVSLVALLYGIGFSGSRALAEIGAQNAGVALQNGHPAEAVSGLISAAARAPNEDRYWRLLADASNANLNALSRDPQASSTDIQNAISETVLASRQARAVNPSSAANIAQMGAIYEQLSPFFGNAASLAAAAFADAERLEPTNPILPTERGRSLLLAADYADKNIPNDNSKKPSADDLKAFRDDQTGKAATAIDEALKLKSDYAPAKFLHALIAVRRNQIDQALKELNELATSNPQDKVVAYERGVLYYQQGKTAEAKDAFASAVKIDPQYSNAHYFLGIIADAEGRTADAVSEFQIIAKVNPNIKEIQTILNNLRSGKPALDGISAGPTPAVTSKP